MEQTLVSSSLDEKKRSFKVVNEEILPVLQQSVQDISKNKSLKKILKKRKGATLHILSKDFDGKTLASLCKSIHLGFEKKAESEESPKKTGRLR